jgi:preprotein translocase subunit SecY
MVSRSFLLNQENLLNRIKVTLSIVILTRLGNFISVPGVEQIYFSGEIKSSTLFIMFHPLLHDEAFLLGVFTLGILPSLNASLAIQLLSPVLPPLKRLQKEDGEPGKKKIIQFTRYLTAIIAFQYSFAIAFAIKAYVFSWDLNHVIIIVFALMTGSLIILWLSEIINETGLGNGASLFIFVNIISTLPNVLKNFNLSGNISTEILLSIAIIIGIISITVVQDATRQIPTISLKELRQKSANNKEHFLAFKLNPSGIMPLILSSSVLNFLFIKLNDIALAFKIEKISTFFYIMGSFFLTLLFSYFYSTIALNPTDLSKELRKKGSSIPTKVPGIATMKFLQEIINRVSLIGGIFLALIVSIPSLLSLANIDFPELRGISGTSILILSGVAVEVSRQIRTYSIFGSYDNIEPKKS